MSLRSGEKGDKMERNRNMLIDCINESEEKSKHRCHYCNDLMAENERYCTEEGEYICEFCMSEKGGENEKR